MDSFKIGIIIFTISLTCVYAKNIKSAFELHEYLLTNYSSDIRPVHDDNVTTEVNVIVFLMQVFRLDEASGELVTSMGLSFAWFDENLKWNPADFEFRYKMEIETTKIWRPALRLLSPSQKSERLGKEEDMAVVYHHGLVTLSINDIFHTSCAVHITYYPFDSQLCGIWFAFPEYGKLLRFNPFSPVMNESFFFDNPIWEVKETSVMSVSTGYNYNLLCRIRLQRRATFYVLNILTPILILMILNSMVFALPAESGERVGFSVTLLLSVAVYMTIISDKLPNTSKPAPILIYVLAAYFSQSAFICIKTILSLRIYYRDDNEIPVPRMSSWFVRYVIYSSCCLKGKKHEITKEQYKEGISSNDLPCCLEKSVEDIIKTNQTENITWKNVASFLDTVFLISNLFLCVMIAVVFFCLVYFRPF